MARVQYGPGSIWPGFNMARVQYGPGSIWPGFNMARVQYGPGSIWPGFNMARVRFPDPGSHVGKVAGRGFSIKCLEN